MKKSSLRAQKVKRTFCLRRIESVDVYQGVKEVGREAYIIRVVHLQHPTPALIDLLMALSAPAHAQRRVHVHIMARQIQADQALEDDAPPGECRSQEHKQACCSAPVRHHVQDCTELGGLFKAPCCKSVQRI